MNATNVKLACFNNLIYLFSSLGKLFLWHSLTHPLQSQITSSVHISAPLMSPLSASMTVRGLGGMKVEFREMSEEVSCGEFRVCDNDVCLCVCYL